MSIKGDVRGSGFRAALALWGAVLRRITLLHKG
jgi:hypothetical protein